MSEQRSVPAFIYYSAWILLSIAVIYFPSLVTFLSALSLVVITVILVLCLHPNTTHPQVAHNPRHFVAIQSTVTWLFKILLLQVLYGFFVFLCLYTLFQQAFLIEGTTLTGVQFLKLIKTWEFTYWGLFPWGLMASVAAGLSWFLYTHGDLDFRGLFRTKKNQFVAKGFICDTSSASTAALFALTSAFCVLLITDSLSLLLGWGVPKQFPLIVNVALLLPMSMLVIYPLKQKALLGLRRHKVLTILGWYTGIILFILFVLWGIDATELAGAPLHVVPWLVDMMPPQLPFTRLGFYVWSCGICSVLAVAVGITKISLGKSIRQIVLGALCWPVIIGSVSMGIAKGYFPGKQTITAFLMNTEWTSPLSSLTLGVLGLLSLIVHLGNLTSTRAFLADVSQRGRVYEVKIEPFILLVWQSGLAFIMINFAGELRLLTLLTMPLALLAGATILLIAAASFKDIMTH